MIFTAETLGSVYETVDVPPLVEAAALPWSFLNTTKAVSFSGVEVALPAIVPGNISPGCKRSNGSDTSTRGFKLAFALRTANKKSLSPCDVKKSCFLSRLAKESRAYSDTKEVIYGLYPSFSYTTKSLVPISTRLSQGIASSWSIYHCRIYGFLSPPYDAKKSSSLSKSCIGIATYLIEELFIKSDANGILNIFAM